MPTPVPVAAARTRAAPYCGPEPDFEGWWVPIFTPETWNAILNQWTVTLFLPAVLIGVALLILLIRIKDRE
jgi:hypothetical protein